MRTKIQDNRLWQIDYYNISGMFNFFYEVKCVFLEKKLISFVLPKWHYDVAGLIKRHWCYSDAVPDGRYNKFLSR